MRTSTSRAVASERPWKPVRPIASRSEAIVRGSTPIDSAGRERWRSRSFTDGFSSILVAEEQDALAHELGGGDPRHFRRVEVRRHFDDVERHHVERLERVEKRLELAEAGAAWLRRSGAGC